MFWVWRILVEGCLTFLLAKNQTFFLLRKLTQNLFTYFNTFFYHKSHNDTKNAETDRNSKIDIIIFIGLVQQSSKCTSCSKTCRKHSIQKAKSHGSVFGSGDVTHITVQANVQANISACDTNYGSPKQMKGGKLIEKVVVDNVSYKWKLKNKHTIKS